MRMISLRLEDEDYETIASEAKKEGRSLNNYITHHLTRGMIESALDHVPPERRAIASALAGAVMKKPIKPINLDDLCKHGFSKSSRLCKYGCK